MKPLLIDTTALVSWLSSASLRLRAVAEARATALPASLKLGVVAFVIVTTGASAVGVMVTVAPAVLLRAWPEEAPSLLASRTWIEIWRVLELAVGSSELLRKATPAIAL